MIRPNIPLSIQNLDGFISENSGGWHKRSPSKDWEDIKSYIEELEQGVRRGEPYQKGFCKGWADACRHFRTLADAHRDDPVEMSFLSREKE